MTYDEAAKILGDLGLEVVLKGDEIGTVTDVSPMSGITVEKGSQVTVTVSAQ